MRLTEAQRTVLEWLADGGVMIPAGRDEMGGYLCQLQGREDRRVSAKVVSFLFNNTLINVGDAWEPWKISPDGLQAIGRTANGPAAGGGGGDGG